MQVNTISVYSNQNFCNPNQNNLFSKQKSNRQNLRLLEPKNQVPLITPPNVYFHPSFCAFKKFGTEKINIYGAGGDLYNGRLGVRAAFEKLFNIKNISVYDPNPQKLQESGYNLLAKEDEAVSGAIYCLSPSKYHASQVINILKNTDKNIKGIYVEKPMCTAKTQLKELESAIRGSNIPIYSGDHYLFSNLAGLRLMGVDMPFDEYIKINFDNTKNKKFTKCIRSAKSYFAHDNIKSITAKAIEHGTEELLSRNWLQKKEGGGILLDIQSHIFNLLNVMGLKTTEITSVYGLKYPFINKQGASSNVAQQLFKSQRGVFRPIEKGEVEDRVLMTGKVNDKILATFECSQFMPKGEKYITIEGDNGERINFLVSSGERKVQVLDENNQVLAEAVTTEKPYNLMIEHAQSYFTKERDDELPSLFLKAQKATLEQIFEVKDRLGL